MNTFKENFRYSLLFGCSMLLGFLTVKFGSFTVPLLLGILSAMIFLIILSMPSLKNNGSAAAVSGPGRSFYTKIKGSRPSRCFLAFSGAAFFAKSVLFIFARSIGMVYFIQSLQCLSYGLMAASRVYYVDETVGKENETTGQAYMAASETVGIVLGSSLGGFLMQAKGINTLLSVGTAVCLAGMLLMTASLFARTARKNR